MVERITDHRFTRYAWFVLAYHIFVILTGAYVRATSSGAGCGNHWPTCNGQIIPRAPAMETVIEFAHRLSTGLALPLVIVLVVWAFRAFPARSPVRRVAVLSLVFIIIEALIGAFLVRRDLVADNASLFRAVTVGLHLANTYLLIGFLALTAWWGSGRQPTGWRGPGTLALLLGVGLLALLVVGMFGAVTALGDTLFPSAGLQEDFSPTAHLLIRLRIWHPILAVVTTLYLFIVAALVGPSRVNAESRRLTWILLNLLVVQLLAGAVNVILRAPIWLQLVHLLLSDLIWISLVLLSSVSLTRQASSLATGKAQSVEMLVADGAGV